MGKGVEPGGPNPPSGRTSLLPRGAGRIRASEEEEEEEEEAQQEEEEEEDAKEPGGHTLPNMD